jgi:hypothetical protein
MPPASHRRSLTAKLFASIGVVGAAASCAGLATYADPVSVRGATAIHSSRPHLVAMTRVLQPISTIAPGDRVSRTLTLHARGRGFRRLRLTVKSKGVSMLTDRAQGLRLTISRCAKRWRTRRSGYTCRGKAKLVLKPGPVLGRRKLSRASIKRGKKLFLLLTLVLPADAGNTFQHQRSTLVYRFVGR